MAVPPRYLEPARRRAGRRRRRPRAQARPRRRLPVRALGALVLAALAAGGAYAVVASRGDDGRGAVERFVAAWERGDHRAMHAELTADARTRAPLPAFAAAYRRAAATATATSLRGGAPRERDGGWEVPVTVRTRLFGLVRAPVRIAVGGDPVGIEWTRALVFPGLRAGARLRRVTLPPRRAPLLARDGRLLARSNGLPTELGGLTGIVGELGRTDSRERRRALAAEGFPPNAVVGVSGLQLALDRRLRGTAGGTLFAGRRVLARRAPRPAPAVRSSIDPGLTRTANGALAGRFGSIAAIEPATGEVLALAGIALDGAQPPGSTFKIMTVTAALEAGIVTRASRFPVQTGANAGGRYIANAHDEACGGDLTESFAKSCNSVFAPMGVKVGLRRMVDVAERFGFNRPTGIPAATTGSMPRDMTPVELGASSIGQGRVLATSLNMAVVAATIANDGRRPLLTLLHGARPRTVRATTAEVSGLVERLMVAVVEGADATGKAARIPGVEVAGKTGTAELGGDQENDAWFVAYAPAGARPRVAVSVLVVHGGFGGETAAPIAREVMAAALGRG